LWFECINIFTYILIKLSFFIVFIYLYLFIYYILKTNLHIEMWVWGLFIRHTFIFSVPGHSVSQICSFRSPSGNPFSSPISVFHFHSFFRSSFSISLIDPHILHFMLREILFPASSISLVQIHFQFSIFIFILFFAVWNSRFWCNRCLLWLIWFRSIHSVALILILWNVDDNGTEGVIPLFPSKGSRYRCLC